jgi:hypothetical protein
MPMVTRELESVLGSPLGQPRTEDELDSRMRVAMDPMSPYEIRRVLVEQARRRLWLPADALESSEAWPKVGEPWPVGEPTVQDRADEHEER